MRVLNEENRKRFPVVLLCSLLGKTKQTYYKGFRESTLESEIRIQMAIDFAQNVRSKAKGIGAVKIWWMYKQQTLKQFRLGRDKFILLMSQNGLTARKRQRKPRTTDSCHNLPLYPNLVKDLIPHRPNQVWFSDMTYLPSGSSDENKFFYLSLITDGYTHQIVGWALRRTLSSEGPLKALETALSQLDRDSSSLIHHSDRGVQYASLKYTRILKENGVFPSMTESGDPKENAVAERVHHKERNYWGTKSWKFSRSLKKSSRCSEFL